MCGEHVLGGARSGFSAVRILVARGTAIIVRAKRVSVVWPLAGLSSGTASNPPSPLWRAGGAAGASWIWGAAHRAVAAPHAVAAGQR